MGTSSRAEAGQAPAGPAPARTSQQSAGIVRQENRAAERLVAALLGLQRAAGNRAVSRWLVPDPVPRDGGAPLPADARADLEARFGYDLGTVRVHVGSQTTAAVGVKAVTRGRHISLGPGRGLSDRTLLAHEVAHVVQQATGETGGLHGADGDPPRRAALEAGARQAAATTPAVASRRPRPPLPSPAPVPVVQFDFDQDVLGELRRLPSAEAERLTDAERRGRVDVLAARKARLEALFVGLPPDAARRVRERLRERHKGDPLSERFHDILATATRKELLAILQRAASAETDEPPAKTDEPPMQQTLRLDETVSIKGLPKDQPNYADRAFRSIWSAPVGDIYTLSPQAVQGQGQAGIEVPKAEFHLDADPLTGFTIVHNQVYRSRDVAEAVLRYLQAHSPGMNVYTFYLRDGYIFPTTLSESTIPALIGNLRQVRESDRADLQATADLAKNVAWWYVGARFPIRIKGGGGPPGTPPRVPPAAVAAGVAAFDAARVAEELAASTGTIANAGQRMLAGARVLSGMRNLTAAQKVEVMLHFFQRIGFIINKEGVVDEGLYFIMKSDDARYAFRFVKDTAEIIYGRFDPKILDYAWEALR
jgi:Domain of unknown function (DUF4157)